MSLCHSIVRTGLAFAAAAGLSACVSTGPVATQPLPSGVVRGADGTLYYDPDGSMHAAAGMARPTMAPDTISHWDGGPGNGPANIRIDLSEQTAYFYRGTTLVGQSWISSGDATHRTPTGRFSIIFKNKNHRSSRYGAFVDAAGNVVDPDVDKHKDPVPDGLRYEGASMTNCMRITKDGIAMHAGILPGYPASHGCIRMPEHMSEIFFDNTKEGTPVWVHE